MSKIEEVTPARYAGGTFEKIAAVLAEGEPRSEFIREATEREIARRMSMIERSRVRRKAGRRTIYERKPSRGIS